MNLGDFTNLDIRLFRHLYNVRSNLFDLNLQIDLMMIFTSFISVILSIINMCFIHNHYLACVCATICILCAILEIGIHYLFEKTDNELFRLTNEFINQNKEEM